MPDYIAIGDIHGMDSLLVQLLEKLPTDGEIIFLGDYIDRGPQSRAVITHLLQLQQQRLCHFLRGNHEAILLSSLDGNTDMRNFWLRNGGLQTLESYDREIPPTHEEFFRRTLPYYTTDAYIFVHAGLVPGRTLEEIGPDEFLWIREPFLSTDYNWGKVVIHGHTPTRKFPPQIYPNRINVDTGAVFGGALTAVLLPEYEFISIPASAG
ncbi:MAG TPA: metallophosphoesterase family protein [Armatimonadota bacterium]|nr:metallophosphoesterase family protein [Armatimonadota bacterium]